MREGLGFLLGLLLRVWLATLRVRLVVDPALEAHRDVPWVLALFHGTFFPLLVWGRYRKTTVLVSLSKDGSLLAGALRALGFRVVRGSSSRGAARGTALLVRRAREGSDLAFAVDGPRGPRGVVKPGAAWAAARVKGALVPMGGAVQAGKTFGSWDRFALAWPFGRIAVVLGAPVSPDLDPEELGEAIRATNAEAAKLL